MNAQCNCPFCKIVKGELPATIIREWPDALAIVPRRPLVRDGHILVIPKAHVKDMSTDPAITGLVAMRAAQLINELNIEHGQFAYNLGEFGGQTVWHLHGHIVVASSTTRHTMPWTGQFIREDREYFVKDTTYGLALYFSTPGTREFPQIAALKNELDKMSPDLWAAVTAVLPNPAPIVID